MGGSALMGGSAPSLHSKGVGAAEAAMAAPLFDQTKIFLSILAVGAARSTVYSRLLTDRDS